MAFITRDYLNCVIAIGDETDTPDSPDWVGTGFLVGRPYRKDGIALGNHVFLVTNKHVIEGMDSFIVRFNPLEGGVIMSHRFVLIDSKNKKRLWTSHLNDDIDIAAIEVNSGLLHQHKRLFGYFLLDEHLMSFDKMAFISEGDFVYVLGYPMNLVDPYWHYPIVRSGTVARIQDMLDDRKLDFLLDVLAFPGNSGSPVILKPEISGIEGATPIGTSYVIGIITSHEVYREVAISPQTGNTRVTFEENSGLARALPAKYISETVEAHFNRMTIGPNHELFWS
ncbi:MAG: serine protease [Halobacteriota archaeon]